MLKSTDEYNSNCQYKNNDFCRRTMGNPDFDATPTRDVLEITNIKVCLCYGSVRKHRLEDTSLIFASAEHKNALLHRRPVFFLYLILYSVVVL